MSPKEELEQSFNELFELIRQDVVNQIYRNLKEYSVRGETSNLFRPEKWREFVRNKIKPIYDKYLSRSKSEAAVQVVNDAANRYASQIADVASINISKVDTIEQLVSIVKNVPELNRQSLWAVVEGNALEQAVQLKNNKKKFKVWNTFKDDRVRETVHADHVMMEGVKIPVNHKFQLITGLADHPGDPVGLGPADRINCRCYLTYTD